MAWFAFYVLRSGGSGGGQAAGGRSRYGYVSSLGPSLTGSLLKVAPSAHFSRLLALAILQCASC